MSTRLPLALVLSAVLFATASFAATKKSQRNSTARDSNDSPLMNDTSPSPGSRVSGSMGNLTLSQDENPGGGLILAPGSPDNWNGGTGNWSNAAKWSTGTPNNNSDVTIYSGGNDLVTLDVGSTTVESLQLGGAQNGHTSELTDGGAAQTLTITNGFTLGATGSLQLIGNGSSVSAGSIVNNGFVTIGSGATLNLTNQPGGVTDVPVNANWLIQGNFAAGGAANTGFANLASIEGTVTFENGQSQTIDRALSIGQSGNSALTVGNGTSLTINGNVNISGAALRTGYMSGGNNVLNITGSLTNTGVFGIAGNGDMATVGGTVTSDGGFGVAGKGAILTVGGFDNTGFASVGNGSTFQINGNVNNSATGNLYTSGGNNVVNITGSLTNNGNFAVGQPGDMGDMASIGNGLTNAGEVFVQNGSSLQINGNVNNSFFLVTDSAGGAGGNILNITGSLTNSLGFELTGPGDMGMIGNGLTNNAGADVDVENGSTLHIGGDVTSSGTLATGLDYPYYSGANRLTITGNLSNQAGGQFILNGVGDMASIGNGLTNNAGGFVEVQNGSTLNITGNVDNSGTMETRRGVGNTLSIIGNLTNNGEVGFLGTGDKGSISGDVTNNGTGGFFVAYGSDGVVGGNLTNAAGGIVDVEIGSTLTVGGDVNNSGSMGTNFVYGLGGGNTLNVNGKLTNQASGQFVLNGPGDVATLGSLNNSGFVDVENGSTLMITGDANNSGSMTADFVAHGNGSNTITINGTLTNSGLFGLYGDSNRGFNSDYGTVGNLVNAGTVNIGGTSQLTVNGDVNNSGTISTAGLVVNTGFDIIRISGNLTNQAGGQFILYGGIFGNDLATIGGGLTNAGLVDVENLSTLQIGGDVTNSGTLETNAFGNGGSNAITITGMLTNAPTGQITLNGPGDVLVALAGLTNNGSISVNNGSTIDPPFVNNIGTMNIGSLSKFVVGTGNPGGTGYIQLANGTLGEMISSTNFGVINVNGSALLDGTLAVLLQGGYNPAVGSMYKFLLANPGQINGTFASILNDIFNGGTEKWLVTYDNADGFVELTAEANNVPEPATLLVLIPGLLGVAYGLRRRRSASEESPRV